MDVHTLFKFYFYLLENNVMIVPLNWESSSKRFLTDNFFLKIVEMCKLKVIYNFLRKNMFISIFRFSLTQVLNLY